MYHYEYVPTGMCCRLQWDFVCDKEELAEVTQTLLIVGMMLGTFVCPTFAGKALIICLL